MSPPDAVLTSWSEEIMSGLEWERVQSGFSGAIIFKGMQNGYPKIAVKGWPSHISIERVQEIHGYQISLLGECVIPVPFEIREKNGTAVFADDRVWEVSPWIPGKPCDESPFPPPKRKSAVEGLRKIHTIWKRFGVTNAPCPAVLRRVLLIDNFRSWHASYANWPVDPILATAMTRVPGALSDTRRQLLPWADQQVPVQMCFTDIHRDHLLFYGGEFPGFIDFGAVKPDSPACDLARLFGEEPITLIAAEAEYGNLPVGLAGTLATTAPVCNLAAWILRIARDRENPSNRDAVSTRIAGWVERMG